MTRSAAARGQLNPIEHAPRQDGSTQEPHPNSPASRLAAANEPPITNHHPPRQGGTMQRVEPIRTPSPPAALLRIYADTLDDFEKARISTQNRLGALEREGLDDSPESARLRGLLDGLQALEHGVDLELRRALRRHPLGAWVKETVGVGEKQGARLIASIGDPGWNDLYDRPRTLSELWAYCGYHTVPAGDQRLAETHGTGVPRTAPRRKRGQQGNWNATARMRAFLVAESCIKHRHSPYRSVYEIARTKYAESIHDADCIRCKSPAGTPLSLAHQHARALRIVAKEVLRDLWLRSRLDPASGGVGS